MYVFSSYAALPPYEIQGVVDTLMKDYQKRGYPPPLELLGPYGRPPPMGTLHV